MTDTPMTAGRYPVWRSLVWYGLALAGCLLIVAINGGGLYYFDTAGYLEQGRNALQSIGLIGADVAAGGDGGTGGAAEADDGLVVGSRAAVYSVLVAAVNAIGGLNGVPVFHSLVFILAVWLPARVCVRLFDPSRPVALVTSLPVLIACVGALPFYTAFLMPDIFAPVMLLSIATLTIFVRDMTVFEILLALALGIFAVVVHPSHLLIAVLMVPLAAIASLLFGRRRWWLAPLCVALMVVAGFAERAAFTQAVKSIQSAEVVYQPFLTVRSIADGPGYRYLAEKCPDETIPTCALYDALQVSPDPMRLTASHIMFETSANLGSYQLLPKDDRKAIADGQMQFFLSVALSRPVEVTLAFLGNTLAQANRYSVTYTIPTSGALANIARMTDTVPESFKTARLLDKRSQLEWLTTLHSVLYGLSALLVVVIVVLPQQAPPLAMRGFAMMLLIGVLVNAFVCGGVSQPSDRYGARVAFLLPVAATFLILFYAGARRKPPEPVTAA